MRAIEAFNKSLSAVLRWVCIILFAAMVLVVTLQVVVRFMGIGAAWSEPVARYLFIWLGLIGAAFVIGENDDVAIDFLVRKFPAAVAKSVEIVAHAIVAAFAVIVMIIGGARFAIRTWDQAVELLPVTTGQVYFVLPVSGALIVIYSVIHIIETIVRPLHVRNDEDIDISTVVEEGI